LILLADEGVSPSRRPLVQLTTCGGVAVPRSCAMVAAEAPSSAFPKQSGEAAWSAEADQANAEFGASVASAGDVNGDGGSDVIVGARLYDGGELNEGKAYVYHSECK
jgi:hypothetical protein